MDATLSGRKLRGVTVNLTYDDSQETVTVPAGTKLLACLAHVDEAFGGAALLDVGVSSDTDSIIADYDISSIGVAFVESEWVDGSVGYETSQMEDIYVTVDGATTGSVYVTLIYSLEIMSVV